MWRSELEINHGGAIWRNTRTHSLSSEFARVHENMTLKEDKHLSSRRLSTVYMMVIK